MLESVYLDSNILNIYKKQKCSMMKNLYLFLLMLVPLTFFGQATNQAADPAFVSLTQSPITNPLGDEAIINARITNSGTEPIVANGLFVTFSWSPLYEFVGFENGAETGFTVFNSGPQTITLRNTNNEIDPANFEVLDLKVRVVAVMVGELESITGNVQRAPGYAAQVGNLSITNDNAQGGQAVILPAPITLQSFDAVAQGEDAVLTWITASEENNDYFVVERSIDGGVSFAAIGDKIGSLAVDGNSESDLSYSFRDKAAGTWAETVYYRVRQVDFDGASSTTPIRAVDFSEIQINGLSVFPNPVVGGADFIVQAKEISKVEVYTLQGDLVRVLEEDASAQRTTSISTADLAKGMYIVVINGKESKKLVVQ